ncbi:MAG TPA: tetratricopeptide repeat protein [Terriglobales bacterium]|nr:tetratricopeptide repeat protein [Terriglobales bacterium]
MIRPRVGARRATSLALILLLCLAFAGCTTTKQRFARAAQLEDRGDYAGALAQYEQLVVRVDAGDRVRLAFAYRKAGECLWHLGRGNEALKAFERANALDPKDLIAPLRTAELYVAVAPERSIEIVRLVLASDPNNAEALSVLGAAYSVAGQLPLARIAYARSLEIDPTRVSVAVALAELDYRDLDTAHARAVLRQAASAAPRSSVPWLALGRLEEQEGDANAAEEAYRHAVAAENTPETNLRMAQFLQRNARIGEAEKILRQADALQPWLPTALPDFEFQSGRVANAAKAYASALQPGRLPAAPGAKRPERGVLAARVIEADLSQPSPNASQAARQHLEQYKADLDPITTQVLWSEIFLVERNLLDARKAAASAVAQAADSAAAHYALGVVEQRSGDVSAAGTEWARAIALDGDFIPARLALAEQLLQSDQPRLAEEHVALVLRTEPANLGALCLFARVLLREKRYDSALAIAHRAVAADTTAAEPRMVLGEIAMAQGSPGAALIHFEQAVLLDPHSAAAEEGLVRVYRTGHVTRPMLAHMEDVAWRAPRSATLMEIAGRLYRDHGWTADAERCFRRALSIDDGRATAAAELAQTYAAHGALDEAAHSLALTGSDAALLLDAFQAEQRHDTPGAIRQYEDVVHRGDKTGVAANNLAWLYAQQGTNLDRALQLAQYALTLAPYNPRVLDTMGFVRMQRREYTEAVRSLKKALDMARAPLIRGAADPQLVAELRTHLAAAYRRAGQPEEAEAVARD